MLINSFDFGLVYYGYYKYLIILGICLNVFWSIWLGYYSVKLEKIVFVISFI